MAQRATRQREGDGLVRLRFVGELRVPATDPLTYEEWQRLVTCPQCGASTDITLEALDRLTVAICPREDTCGRAWLGDDILSAFQLRQMHHLHVQGEEIVTPHPNRVTVMLVPDLVDDDLTLQDDPDPDGTTDDPYTWWAINCSAVIGQHAAPLVVALGWARGLLSWSLPQDGELFEHLYPGVGGSAEDGHMTQVVLGLAIHETARDQGIHEFKMLELDAIAAQLDGDRVEQLRGARPMGLGRDGGRLRRSDVSRLENASDDQWRLWCHLAGEVIAGHCESQFAIHGGKGSTWPLTARIKPWAGRLGLRRSHFLQSLDLDLAWYQPGDHR